MSKKSYSEMMAERERGTTRPYTPDHHNHLLPLPQPEPVQLVKGWVHALVIFLAVLLIGYAGYGVFVDDLYIPIKRSPGHHFNGAGAILMFMTLLSFAALMITLTLCRYDAARKRLTNRRLTNVLSVTVVVFMMAAFFADR